MKKILALVFAILPSGLAAEEVPDWVPNHKRAAFAEYVRSAEANRLSAEEWAAVLNSKRVIEQCNIDGKRIIYHTRRGTLVERFTITYNDQPKRCSVDAGKALVDFEEDSFWQRLWDNRNEYSVVAIIFFTIGALAL